MPSNLHIHHGDSHETLQLPKLASILVFGRSRDCQIQAPAHDLRVSRNQFQIEIKPPCFKIRDLGSRHGTILNGKLLTAETVLHDGDRFGVGEWSFEIEIPRDSFPNPAIAFLEAIAQPREIIAGRFEIIKPLARGEHAKVYQVRSLTDSCEFAVKKIDSGSDPKQLRLLERELRLQSRISHPHLIAILDHFLTEESLFLLLPLCRGGSLQDRLLKKRTLEPAQALLIFDDALQGLAHLHSLGIVHRDLKPDNILFRDTPGVHAMIGDFGLAKARIATGLSALTRTGELAGSPYYMSRECLVDYKYAKPSADVFAIGVCLYQSLSGVLPRNYPPGGDPVLCSLHAPTIPLGKRCPVLPKALCELVDRALSEAPSQRYPDAQSFLAELRVLRGIT